MLCGKVAVLGAGAVKDTRAWAVLGVGTRSVTPAHQDCQMVHWVDALGQTEDLLQVYMYY